jgi:hypothetical protein
MIETIVKQRNVALDPFGLLTTAAAQYQYTAMIKKDHTLEDIQVDGYWMHNAKMLKPQAEIRCIWEDNSRYAILFVVDSGTNWAKVVVLEDYDLQKTAVLSKETRIADEANYTVEWKGPVHKHSVIRKSDSVNVSKGHETKEAAEEARAEMLKTLAR